MKPALKRNLSQVAPFTIVGFIFGVIYAILERGLLGHLDHYPSTGNPYHFINNSLSSILQSVIMGTLFGISEVFLFIHLFRQKTFLIKFILKSILYIIAILICIIAFSIISSSMILNEGLFSSVVRDNLAVFFKDISFWGVMLYIGAVFSLAMLVIEMSHHLGQGVFRKFLFGKYHTPREEERIFMFLDIKSSTTLAEEMGHIQYFRFLNEYYIDISKAIIENEGEIYQYVGDEVVITWALKNKIIYDKCITCFFAIKNIIKLHADQYLTEYGHVPEFKAGLHCGKVTTGRIGILKKELVFTGDALNTASRIQGVCNTHHVDILLSEPLVYQLQKISAYQFKKVGDIQLRGKLNSLALYTI